MSMRDLIEKLRLYIESDWKEGDHPRANDGRFGDKPGESAAPAAPQKKAKAKTYVQAKADTLKHLESKGWKMSPGNLKIPHATSPDGETRLWFKAQAVYYTRGNKHDFKNARTMSYDLDLRKMSPEDFESFVSKHKKDDDAFTKKYGH